MAATLERIGRVNPALNAIVSLREPEELLAEAAERDAELARGERRGWMHGLPHAVKDLEETAGIVTTSGSPLFADFVPEADSEVVRRIKGAGAIVIGKTNVPEFGYGSQTYNDVFGPTRNPYDADEDRRRVERRRRGRAGRRPRARSPTAATTWARCATRPRSATSTASGRRSAGSCSPPLRVGVRGADRHRRPDGPHAARPRRAAGDARRAAPECRSRSTRTRPALAAPLEPPDPARIRIGWLGDLGGHLPFEPGILELCEAALARARRAGRRRSSPASTPPRHGMPRSRSATTTPPGCSSSRASGSSPSCARRPTARAAVTGPALHAAQRTRTHVAAALRALLRDLRRARAPERPGVPVRRRARHWPREVAGRPMPTYHRWMEVMIYASLAGLPAAGVPAGFGPQGLPMGLQLIGRPRGDRALLELTATAYAPSGARVAAMPELVLHALPPSHPCMTAEAALRLKGLAYERIDFTPGEHTAKMAELYGEGNTTVPGLHDRRRAGPRLADDPRAARGARARAGALPRGDRRTPCARPSAGATRSSRTSAAGCRGARCTSAPRRSAASAAPARWTRRAPTSRSGSRAASWKYHRHHGRAARRRPRRPARQARPRRRARRAGHDRRRAAERRRPADRRHAARAAHRRRPAAR